MMCWASEIVASSISVSRAGNAHTYRTRKQTTSSYYIPEIISKKSNGFHVIFISFQILVHGGTAGDSASTYIHIHLPSWWLNSLTQLLLTRLVHTNTILCIGVVGLSCRSAGDVLACEKRAGLSEKCWTFSVANIVTSA
jgi:hypothetical protein